MWTSHWTKEKYPRKCTCHTAFDTQNNHFRTLKSVTEKVISDKRPKTLSFFPKTRLQNFVKISACTVQNVIIKYNRPSKIYISRDTIPLFAEISHGEFPLGIVNSVDRKKLFISSNEKKYA